jgi:segregation and condensation protein B
MLRSTPNETMSLKAKIEAVIYASEEPVTLVQLAGLLGHEAQAELDHLDSAQHRLALEQAGEAAADEQAADAVDPDEDALNSEVLTDESEAQSDMPAGETESQHAEALDRHLHEVAAMEAAHAKAVRERSAAATAAMTSDDPMDAPAAGEATGQGDGATSLPVTEGGASAAGEAEGQAGGRTGASTDEKKLAREAREKERRLREYFRTILDQRRSRRWLWWRINSRSPRRRYRRFAVSIRAVCWGV